jgi:chromosomal replication initiation ATPase DnaA
MGKKKVIHARLNNEYNAAARRYYDTQMDCIWEAVARVCNVPDDAIQSKSRVAEWKMARFYFWYFVRTRTDVTWVHMGQYAGKRDHSTAIHGYQSICDWAMVEKPVKRRIEQIEEVLDGRMNQADEFFAREKKLHYGFL